MKKIILLLLSSLSLYAMDTDLGQNKKRKVEVNEQVRNVRARTEDVTNDKSLIVKKLIKQRAEQFLATGDPTSVAYSGLDVIKALANQKPEDAIKLLTQGSDDVNAADINNSKLTNEATTMEDVTDKTPIINRLIAQGAQLSYDKLAVMRALDNNKINEASKLLELGADVNASDKDGMTALHWATRRDSTDIAMLLINNKANVNAQSACYSTPISFAAHHGAKNMVELLINNKADVNAKDGFDQTPLQKAIEKNHRDIVNLLLKANANVNAKLDECDWTALHEATENNNREIVDLLINNKANVNAIDINGNTPLHEAAHLGKRKIIDSLIKAGADVNVKNEDGKTPLEIINKNSQQTKKRKLEEDVHGRNVKARIEVEQNKAVVGLKAVTPIINLLISKGAQKLENLIDAVHDNNSQKVKELIAAGIYVNGQDKNGRTALFVAAEDRHADIVRELLKSKDIKLNLADKDGMTALQIAVTNGDVDIVAALLEVCIPLSQFMRNRRLQRDRCMWISESLDWNGREKDGIYSVMEQRDKKLHFTPFARAAKSGNEEIIKLLLSARANPTALITTEGKDVAASALYKGHDQEVTDLIKSKTKEFVDRGSAVINALRHTMIYAAGELLAYGIDVNATDIYGRTPLHGAAIHSFNYSQVTEGITLSNKDITKLLIKAKANVNQTDKNNWTPLHLAAQNRSKDNVQLLINNKADVNNQNIDGETAMHLAAKKDYRDIVQILIDNKANLNNLNIDGESPLFLAVKSGFNGIVSQLIENKASVNERNHTWNTPLMEAVIKGDKTLVSLLVRSKADVNARDAYNKTALSLATELRHKRIIDVLKAAKAIR